MIKRGSQDISQIRRGTKTIIYVYRGEALVFDGNGEVDKCCFSNGYWVNTLPWNNQLGWKN